MKSLADSLINAPWPIEPTGRTDREDLRNALENRGAADDSVTPDDPAIIWDPIIKSHRPDHENSRPEKEDLLPKLEIPIPEIPTAETDDLPSREERDPPPITGQDRTVNVPALRNVPLKKADPIISQTISQHYILKRDLHLW